MRVHALESRKPRSSLVATRCGRTVSRREATTRFTDVSCLVCQRAVMRPPTTRRNAPAWTVEQKEAYREQWRKRFAPKSWNFGRLF